MSFLDDYEPVEDRLAKFWDDYPNGKVLTELLLTTDGQYIVKAFVFKVTPSPVQVVKFGELLLDQSAPDATGHAQETVGSSNVNTTSALENCETSAIGRALANLGYAAKGKRPSREEMVKVKESGEPSKPAHVVWLADAVQIFKAWSEDGRRDAYTSAMVYLGYEELDSQEKAEAVFLNMQSQYDLPTEQLPLEGESTK